MLDIYFSVAMVLDDRLRHRILTILRSYAEEDGEGEEGGFEEMLQTLVWRCSGLAMVAIVEDGLDLDLHLSYPWESLAGGAKMVRVTRRDILRVDLPLLDACRWIRARGRLEDAEEAGEFRRRVAGDGGARSWTCEWDWDSFYLGTVWARRGPREWSSSDEEA